MRVPDSGVELRKQAAASLKKTGKGNELVRQQRQLFKQVHYKKQEIASE